jgi:hypothetical protein
MKLVSSDGAVEALPPWLNEKDRPDVFEFVVALDMDFDDVTRAADDWDSQLGSFPER